MPMIPNTRLAKLQLIEEMDAVRQDGLLAGDEESLWAARIMSEEITKLRRELADEMSDPMGLARGRDQSAVRSA